MSQHPYIISCDWGTTSLRIKLADTRNMQVLASYSSKAGIASTHDQFVASGVQPVGRELFYKKILLPAFHSISQQINIELTEVPVIVSGMASSNMGIKQLPYTSLPCNFENADFGMDMLNSGENFPHRMLLVSGLSTNNDVLRGEEVQVCGCIVNNGGEQLAIVPGTHSKHININKNLITGFSTYMTGELFRLLIEQSTLASGLMFAELDEGDNRQAFILGLLRSKEENLLHTLFAVRTNFLLKKLPPAENYFYLSGLMIGHELKNIQVNQNTQVTLIASGELQRLYQLALHDLYPAKNIIVTSIEDAVVKGHIKLYETHGHLFS